MASVINAVADHENTEEHTSAAELATQYEHLQRCDPATDIRVAELSGEVVGYARTTWDDVSEGYRAYWIPVQAHPDHRGLADELYEWVEDRSAAIAADHPSGDKYLVSWAMEGSPRSELLVGRGYEIVRYSATLVRPDLDDIPQRPLPDGVEVRPVEESHMRQIWEAEVEAFRDHWGYAEQTETDWESWLSNPHRDPSLWQIAWAGDAIVGQVRSFIDPEENRRHGRLRGWTEDISTARGWRRRGIAGALICSSLGVLKERGMTEAALGVDTENLSGAHRLYESLGFRRVRLFGTYRRALATTVG